MGVYKTERRKGGREREGENTSNPNLLASGTGRFTNSKGRNGDGVCVSEMEWGCCTCKLVLHITFLPTFYTEHFQTANWK